ncbi:ribosome biogenesis GTPase YlqF [Leptolyngbya cf. ectocarpi LEGE 11479]|uniref:Ribosome biogenesis GTPase A n=1 Tax=Leptolyngbya cf. ectocarpi LEGE 11479 TaxID=1828722 RepID=A0A928ZW02_LEPEC|nr:ribosome biogenesis GTPase YlqF [Leptolyngbya ectocarpi]MBE9068485.1 ribosome biogenesis GTPase YlqF [Leptolyngbya cf. ectocarpi LEGE 11479]
MSSPSIQWYPGHIAKAERSLKEQLKRVDVVLEVRDARIPLATHHPEVNDWIGDKARVLVLNRVDMISPEARQAWQAWFKAEGQTAYFTNAKQGTGVQNLLRAAQDAGKAMNARRKSRGMRPRPVRAVVIGFPNVGKSALINRLLKRKVVVSERRAGVTRQLRWVRISNEIELLDAPGIIPLKLNDQGAALKLAICDDIGNASYDTQRVAAAFLDLIQDLDGRDGDYGGAIAARYSIPRTSEAGEPYTGESYLNLLAQRHHNDCERVAHQLLNDFRKGNLGNLVLEFPPDEFE